MKKKGLKRLAATLLAGVMCASMLGGCGSKAAASKSSSGGGKDSSKVTIWYYWETKSHQKGLNHIIDEYNASHKNVKVSAKYVPFADFKKQLSIGASAQELPDMVIQDNPDTASYAAMGIYADLINSMSAIITRDLSIPASSMASCTVFHSEVTTCFCSTIRT